MARYKVPICYEKYGYLPVEADTEEEAVEKVRKRLADMTLQEMDEYVEYLPDSEEVDEEGIMKEG